MKDCHTTRQRSIIQAGFGHRRAEEEMFEIPLSQSRRIAHVWHDTHHDRNHVRAQRSFKIC